MSPEQAYELPARSAFPILLRPSFVLGGRGMFIVYDMDELKSVVREAFDAAPGKPVLLDKFLEDAIEVDVDCIATGKPPSSAGCSNTSSTPAFIPAMPPWSCLHTPLTRP